MVRGHLPLPPTTEGYSRDGSETAPALVAGAVSSAVERRAFNPRRPGFDPLTAHDISPCGLTGQGTRLLSAMMRVRIAPGARGSLTLVTALQMVRWRKRSDSPGSHPGVCGFESRADHAGAALGPVVHGLGSGVFTPGNRVRVSVGLRRPPCARTGMRTVKRGTHDPVSFNR